MADLNARAPELAMPERTPAPLAAETADARRALARLTDEIGAAEARHARLVEAILVARDRRQQLAAEVIALYTERAELLEQVSALRLAALELDPPRPVPAHSPDAPVGPEAEAPPPAAAAPPLATPAPYSATPWAALAQTVPKPRNDTYGAGSQLVSRRNEDRYRLSATPDGLVAAVADGAGGSGLFCGAWAETLVSHLPDAALTDIDGLNRWLDGFCLEFRTTITAQCRAQPTKHSKFVREGSYATLAACWLATDQDRVTATWLGYGDSPILVFDRSGVEPRLIRCHPDRLATFARDPQLLSWKALPLPGALKTGAITLTGPATLILASDAIGQHLLFRYLASAAPDGPLNPEFCLLTKSGAGRLATLARAHAAQPPRSFAEDLAILKTALASETAFATMIAAQCEAGLLLNDDATVILIDIDSGSCGATLGARTPADRP